VTTAELLSRSALNEDVSISSPLIAGTFRILRPLLGCPQSARVSLDSAVSKAVPLFH
jgi:hypothetical protein